MNGDGEGELVACRERSRKRRGRGERSGKEGKGDGKLYDDRKMGLLITTLRVNKFSLIPRKLYRTAEPINDNEIRRALRLPVTHLSNEPIQISRVSSASTNERFILTAHSRTLEGKMFRERIITNVSLFRGDW